MGVAVITSRWGLAPFCLRAARCITPNRCCSSTTIRARSRNSTSFWMRAWVPTTMSMWPSSIILCISRLAPCLMSPMSRPTLTGLSRNESKDWTTSFPHPRPGSLPSSPQMVPKCCSARISVGTMIAPWAPLATAWSNAPVATTVLPLPTSPWRRRAMGRRPCMSPVTCSRARDWAPVRGKGKAPTKLPLREPSMAMGRASWPCCQSLFLSRTRSCIRNSSSKARRTRARSLDSSSSG